MKKAIALVHDHRRFQEIEAFCDEKARTFSDRKRFLHKQHENLAKDAAQARDQMNEELEKYAREAGLLPAGFDPKKHHFHYESGAVIVCDEENQPGGLGAILGAIFGGGS